MALLLAGALPDVQQAPQQNPAEAQLSPAEELAAAIVAIGEHQSRMTVPVQIAGAGPYRFIIDTGSERTVIARELARNLGLPPGRTVNVTAMSGTSRVGTVVIPSINVSTIPDIGAIHAPALKAVDLGALGLLGIDMLRDHRIDIDFEAGQMSVAPSVKRKKKRPPKRPDEIVVRAKSLFGQLIVTEASYDGRRIRVILDTGSPVSVGNGAMLRLVRRHTRGIEPTTLISATGGLVQAQFSYVDNVRVGGITFSNMPVAFADVAPFKRFELDDRPALFLGMSTLKSFRRVQIDFANREVRFLMPRDVDTLPRSAFTAL
ncbi:aspartyl protease family protein [Sphingomonas sp. DT-204]|uniref:aspartyl protease family protein n=1 Tax=Sphingomonas sp. DT-204 TaxID=3396166 RepID=UPI003F1B1750